MIILNVSHIFLNYCHSINETISSNVSTIRKFVLTVDSNTEDKFKEAKESLNRSYVHVSVTLSDFTNNVGLWLTSDYCTMLRELEITTMTFKTIDAKLFRKTFQSLTLLEKLSLQDVDIDGHNKTKHSTIDPVEIPTLKTIDMYGTHLFFLLLILPPNLQSLKIGDRGIIDSAAIIPKFLAKLPKLEKLALWKIDFDDFDDIEICNLSAITAPLKNLSIRQLQKPFKSDANFLEFLNRFALTLKELDVGEWILKFPIPSSAIEVIFNKFHNLKVLRLHLDAFPNDPKFYAGLHSNPSIHTLIIVTKNNQAENQALFGVVSKLPNITTLVLNSIELSKEVLTFISTNCANLKTLQLKSMSGFQFKHLRLPHLVNLSICTLRDMNPRHWKDFVRSLRNIESLSIHTCHDEDSLNTIAFNIFTKGLTNIKHLSFYYGFNPVKRHFNQMIKNCKNLQSIRILKSSLPFEDPRLLDKVHQDIKNRPLSLIAYNLNYLLEDEEPCSLFDIQGSRFWKHDEFFFTSDDDDDSYDNYEDYYGSDNSWNNSDSDDDNSLNGIINIVQALYENGIPMFNDGDSDEDSVSIIESEKSNLKNFLSF